MLVIVNLLEDPDWDDPSIYEEAELCHLLAPFSIVSCMLSAPINSET